LHAWQIGGEQNLANIFPSYAQYWGKKFTLVVAKHQAHRMTIGAVQTQSFWRKLSVHL